jgi:hypothetical protein
MELFFNHKLANPFAPLLHLYGAILLLETGLTSVQKG